MPKGVDPFDFVMALRDRLGRDGGDTWLQRGAPRPKPSDPTAFDRVRREYYDRKRRPATLGKALAEELLPPIADGAPAGTKDPDDAGLVHLLRGLQEILLEHPIVARKLFGALVAEGKRFADTEEGQAWARSLTASPTMQEARVAFQVVSLSMLEGTDEPENLPSDYLDAFFRTASSEDADLLLDRLFGGEPDDQDD